MTVAAEACAQARSLGFLCAGIVPWSAVQAHADRIRAWAGAGHAAGMGYMKDYDRRLDRFRASFPEARSVLMAAAALPGPTAPERRDSGRIALYARGKDYHSVLGAKLEALAAWMRSRPGGPAQTRVFVDTAPLPERGLAAAAGLGFIGKNTCFIVPGVGSHVLLGGIVMDRQVSPKEDRQVSPKEERQVSPGQEGTVRVRPEGHGCGSCRKCLEACPAGALTEPYLLDAGRCVAYLTIEHRGEIPEGSRNAVGSNLFGCDRCQDVCPHNRRADRPAMEDLRDPDGLLSGGDLDPGAVLAWRTEDDHRRALEGTAVLRATRDRLRRNACVVAGNLRRGDLSGALRELLAGPDDDMVKAHAVWALEQSPVTGERGASF